MKRVRGAGSDAVPCSGGGKQRHDSDAEAFGRTRPALLGNSPVELPQSGSCPRA